MVQIKHSILKGDFLYSPLQNRSYPDMIKDKDSGVEVFCSVFTWMTIILAIEV